MDFLLLFVVIVFIVVFWATFGSRPRFAGGLSAGKVPYRAEVLTVQTLKGRHKKDVQAIMLAHRGHATPWDKFALEDTDWLGIRSNTYLLAIFDDGRIVACARYFPFMYGGEVPVVGLDDFHRINLVHVLTAHRGKGLGNVLMRELLANTRGNLCLAVDPENAVARKLYEKWGFKAVAEKDGDIEMILYRD